MSWLASSSGWISTLRSIAVRRAYSARAASQNSASNRIWASDITYIWTDDGWAYLAVVLDLFSRRVVGAVVAEHMRDELVLEALDRALRTRETGDDLVHHSDRGGHSRHRP